ncbi:WXG100 family type VII secretion target [Streptomyces sp. NPDC093097]|uniref:WXG100 family type VII secretion target n=1 Tax=Streptomyces sp. NPDC093097 TaxID=3366027 RepID=UPI00381DDD58
MDLNGYLVDKVVPVLELLNIPWPGGDPKTLRALAGRWKRMSQDLLETAEHLNRRVDGVVSVTWHGDAADAFKAHWHQQYESLQATSKNFAEVQKQLDAYADEAEAIVKEITEIALEIAETELAGALLTVVTVGISDAVAAAASGARALKIVKLVERFSKLAEDAENAVLELARGSRLLTRTIKGLSKLVADAVKNTAMNYAGTVGTKLATGQSVTRDDLKNAAIAGTVAAGPGALGQGLGSLGRHGAPNAFEKVLSGEGLKGGAAKAQAIASGAVTSAGGTAAAEWGDDSAAADTATSFVSGAWGAHHAHAYPREDAKGPLQGTLREGFKIAANGTAYAGGGIVEHTLTNGHLPEAGGEMTDKDGAVQLPDEAASAGGTGSGR